MSAHDTEDFRNRPVGEVVADDYRRGAVFKRFGIDFCCSGARTVQEACDRKGVDYETLQGELLAADRSRSGQDAPDVRRWDPAFLADYIVNVHHGYVRETLPVLRFFTTKVARVHGAARPELVEIAGLVEEMATAMDEHMAGEENVLFPHVRGLTTASKEGGTVDPGALQSTADTIRAMEGEHDHAGEVMRRIRELSDDYTPPDWACNTYRAAFAKLEEFEEDLHRHVHLENNILFPATAKLERELSAGAV
jgi:regulator of cell morphogenesis and NO signaling